MWRGLHARRRPVPHDILVRLDTPRPGVAAFSTYDCGPIKIGLNLDLFGDHAAETVARETPLWQVWLQERFATPVEVSKGE